VKTPGADFQTTYAKGCTNGPPAVPADALREGPAHAAARTQLVAQVGDATDALRRCYTDALANVPRLQGRVLLRIVVGGTGAAPQLGVAEDTTHYEAFGCCVATVVREASAPLRAAGSAVVIDYPLGFKLVSMPVGYRYDVGPDFAFARARPEGFELALDGKMYGGAD
jgi:hypothetical protein